MAVAATLIANRNEAQVMNSRSRVLAVLVAVAAIGAAVAVGFRYEVQHNPKPPLVGVVHETEIRIAPEISARLKSLAVTPGQAVRKGETLAELSSPEIAASLEEAKANAESARANLAHVAAGVRQEEIDEAAQRAAVAASNLALAKQQFAAGLDARGEELRQPAAIRRGRRRARRGGRASQPRSGRAGREQGGPDAGATRHRRQPGSPRAGHDRRRRG